MESHIKILIENFLDKFQLYLILNLFLFLSVIVCFGGENVIL